VLHCNSMNVSELVPDQHSIELSVQVLSLLTRATYTHDKSKMHHSSMVMLPIPILTTLFLPTSFSWRDNTSC
jgi:hypothetical protein